MKNMNLIITGGIAASKSIQLYEILKQYYNINIIVSKNAKHFYDFSKYPILEDIFTKDFYEPHSTGDHIASTYEADINLVYPATYNFIGKIANGISDDLPSLVFAASKVETWLFPSMNSRMYENPILKLNKEKLLKTKLVKWIEPTSGRLASGEIGIGRAWEPQEVVDILNNHNQQFSNLKNKNILLNFGRTRTYLDKIRYLTNESSGLMGLELYEIFKEHCHVVKAIVGDCDFPLPDTNDFVKVKTNYEMLKEMQNNYSSKDIVICAAALNDFEFKNPIDKKIEKRNLDLNNFTPELIESVDVLKELGKNKQDQFLVGFSLANDFTLDKAWEKVKVKNLDALILNLTTAMSNQQTQIKILNAKDKKVIDFEPMSKKTAAWEIIKTLNELMK